MHPSSDDILEFWFGHDREDPVQLRRNYDRWFRADAAFDTVVRERFGTTVADAAAGKLADWSDTARGTLALIVLLDQFPRNIHRGTAAAFACDFLALAYCHSGIVRGFDRELTPVERSFFYLPLEHAETIDEQDASVAAYTRLLDEAPAAFRDFAKNNLDYAVEHRELIEKFGRFPHRNAILSRRSSAAEHAFLAATTNRFGQG